MPSAAGRAPRRSRARGRARSRPCPQSLALVLLDLRSSGDLEPVGATVPTQAERLRGCRHEDWCSRSSASGCCCLGGGGAARRTDVARRLARLRPHVRQHAALAADGHHTLRTSRSSAACTRSTSRRSTRREDAASSRTRSRSDGQLYVTTNDDNVFPIDGATGQVVWHFKPSNSGVFKNFGIVANRGVALLRRQALPADARHAHRLARSRRRALIKRVTIAHDVPGAGSNYGYSETSAPICADHRVIFGAAGSEYGTRGFVMAYTTDLRPPGRTRTGRSRRSRELALREPHRRRRQRLDARHGRHLHRHGVLRDGLGDAALLPVSSGPGANPRTDSLIAVDLKTGQTKWWQQLIAGNQWSYDVSQPPLVYDGKVGGKTHHVVSVATMEGVWFAFDAEHRAAVLPAGEGDRPRRAPLAAAGQARHDLPLVASAASTTRRPPTTPRPTTCSTRRPRPPPSSRPADAERRSEQVRARRRLPRARRTATSVSAARLARPRLDQRDRRQHRPARLEVRDARARARRRHHDRLRPRLRGRRRRHASRVRH